MNTDYICERKLQQCNPELHRLFKDSVICLQQLLIKYKNIFPMFTDHTSLHSLEVIAFCNTLIGNENLAKMNSHEIYILLMSAYLHDTGMGISMADYAEFSKKIDFGDYFNHHSKDNIPDIIRTFHNEFSGEYIRKYAAIFDIPSEEHIFSIIQVSRGHRKTDLYDEKEYPTNFKVPSGENICLPYLAALIRLADELDVASDRNLQFIYDINNIDGAKDIMEFKKHNAIRAIITNEKTFTMEVDTSDEIIFKEILKLVKKLNQTLNECRDVINNKTPFKITQEEIIIIPIKGNGM
ncbi:MAG: hypothetical protein RR890_04560 [Longicatena sp.]